MGQQKIEFPVLFLFRVQDTHTHTHARNVNTSKFCANEIENFGIFNENKYVPLQVPGWFGPGLARQSESCNFDNFNWFKIRKCAGCASSINKCQKNRNLSWAPEIKIQVSNQIHQANIALATIFPGTTGIKQKRAEEKRRKHNRHNFNGCHGQQKRQRDLRKS